MLKMAIPQYSVGDYISFFFDAATGKKHWSNVAIGGIRKERHTDDERRDTYLPKHYPSRRNIGEPVGQPAADASEGGREHAEAENSCPRAKNEIDPADQKDDSQDENKYRVKREVHRQQFDLLWRDVSPIHRL